MFFSSASQKISAQFACGYNFIYESCARPSPSRRENSLPPPTLH